MKLEIKITYIKYLGFIIFTRDIKINLNKIVIIKN
jgi:hypothetical protein